MNLESKVSAILDKAVLQRDGEFIWNYDELVDELVKLFMETYRNEKSL